jgi:hypothetical protein
VAANTNSVFITARFRSGSALLWNLFRHVGGCTAYYEPLNERQWFNPATRGQHRDPTHRQVDDYWREYQGLEAFTDYYRSSWIDCRLFMDAGCRDIGLKRYIQTLIDHARGRAVLQFNRMDFRLPWLRYHFPGAKIVHLYRHPRDQWCSVLRGMTCYTSEHPVDQFWDHDGFYLRRWCADLQYVFPFLDEADVSHAYELHYSLWRLSYLF